MKNKGKKDPESRNKKEESELATVDNFWLPKEGRGGLRLAEEGRQDAASLIGLRKGRKRLTGGV